MNCLVLGGAGFIGSHAVEALLAAGHRVRVLEREGCRLENLLGVMEQIDIIYGDLARRADLRAALTGIKVVFHLAGATLPAASNKDPLADIDSNLRAAVILLQEAVAAGVGKVVFASSGGTVYGPTMNLPIGEDHPTSPLSSYGIVKLTTEKYLALFHHLHGLDYTVLRIANPFGERQSSRGAQGAVAVFLGRCKRGERIEIWGNGEVARDYLYIADLAAALVKAATYQGPEKIFNIGGGRALSLNRLLEEIAAVCGCDPGVDYLPARPCDSPVNWLDCRRAESELGWRPQTDFRTALGRTWQWILEHDD